MPVTAFACARAVIAVGSGISLFSTIPAPGAAEQVEAVGELDRVQGAAPRRSPPGDRARALHDI
jgi:hypothetical protein